MQVRSLPAGAVSAAVVACALLSAAPSWAQEGADRVYRDGIGALEKQRWAEAATAMRQAIEMNPTEAPGRRIPIFGGRDYLPYLLLGRVLFAQSDCSGALNAWEESDRQGVARKLRDGEHGKEIDRGYTQCEAKGFLPSPKFGKELDEARAVVRAAADEGKRLADHVAPHGDGLKAEHRKLVAPAESRMQTANDKLASGERSRRAQELADAKAAAAQALADYRAARVPLDARIAAEAGFRARVAAADSDLAAVDGRGREIDALVKGAAAKVALSAAVTAARARTDALVVAAREKIRTASTNQSEAALTEALQLIADADKSYRQVRFEVEKDIRVATVDAFQRLKTRMQDTLAGLDARAGEIQEAFSSQPASEQQGKDFDTAQRGLVRARAAFARAEETSDLEAADAAIRSALRVAPQLDKLAAALALAVPTLPESLKAAAQAFFNGAYSDTVQRLPSDQVETIDRRFRIHGYVLRAAALFGLYQSSGGKDASLRDQALREVAQSRAIDPSFQPNPAAFSPRFIAFFRGAPGQAQ